MKGWETRRATARPHTAPLLPALPLNRRSPAPSTCAPPSSRQRQTWRTWQKSSPSSTRCVGGWGGRAWQHRGARGAWRGLHRACSLVGAPGSSVQVPDLGQRAGRVLWELSCRAGLLQPVQRAANRTSPGSARHTKAPPCLRPACRTSCGDTRARMAARDLPAWQAPPAPDPAMPCSTFLFVGHRQAAPCCSTARLAASLPACSHLLCTTSCPSCRQNANSTLNERLSRTDTHTRIFILCRCCCLLLFLLSSALFPPAGRAPTPRPSPFFQRPGLLCPLC